jgi:hypothetical protein
MAVDIRINFSVFRAAVRATNTNIQCRTEKLHSTAGNKPLSCLSSSLVPPMNNSFIELEKGKLNENFMAISCGLRPC